MNSEYLTLAEAAKIAPGRPSTTALWRWTRKGLLARSGERIRIPHIRVGRYILIHPDELAAFFKRLAEADATALIDDSGPRSRPRRDSRNDKAREAAIEQARRDLGE